MPLAVAILTQRQNENTGKKEWALVSRKDPSKILKWFGTSKPSDEAVLKEERRVQFFKHGGKALVQVIAELVERGEEELAEELTASEALYAFMGWLTTREEVETFSRRHDCAPAADLIRTFMNHYGLENPRDGWDDKLSPIQAAVIVAKLPADHPRRGEDVEVGLKFDLSKVSFEELSAVEQALRDMGISFDTGSDGKVRDWEWDWSLKGPVQVVFRRFSKDNPENRYSRAQHSSSKCMQCDKPPELECLWADGRGHAWFCRKCFNKWKSQDGGRDIVSVKEVKDGKVGKWADNKNPNIKKQVNAMSTAKIVAKLVEAGHEDLAEELLGEMTGATVTETESKVKGLIKKAKLKPVAMRFASNGAGAVVFESKGDNGMQAEKDAKEAQKLMSKAGLSTTLQELKAVGKWRIHIKPSE